MSDRDYITPAELEPGMRVEIVQRPWTGTITGVGVRGTSDFVAVRDGHEADLETSWSVDAISSIRRIPDPLPTTPGERVWAARGTDDPQWWFVQARGARVVYVPASTSSGNYVTDPAGAGLRPVLRSGETA